MDRAIGVMSGTSEDAIDVAVIDTIGKSVVSTGVGESKPYRPRPRRRLDTIADPAAAERAPLAEVKAAVATAHGDAIASVLKDNGIGHAEIDVIGLPSQTILHRPDRRIQLYDERWQIAGLQEVVGRVISFTSAKPPLSVNESSSFIALRGYFVLAGELSQKRRSLPLRGPIGSRGVPGLSISTVVSLTVPSTSRLMAASMGKMPTTSMRPLISPLKGSAGWVLYARAVPGWEAHGGQQVELGVIQQVGNLTLVGVRAIAPALSKSGLARGIAPVNYIIKGGTAAMKMRLDRHEDTDPIRPS
ncbi:hypothetical protein BH10PSE6_BH10PSE6_40370 [soil metagenome]